jgi:hypothetical protein
VFKWIERDDVPADILTFINDKNPDILCIQEYSSSANIDLKVYPHRYFYRRQQIKTGQAIFLNFQLLTKEISFSKF